VSLFGLRIVQAREQWAVRLEVDPIAVGLFGGLWTATLLFLAFVHFAALRTPRTPWAWKIHALIIGIGLTTLVLWPLAVPLLWLWLKPQTRAFFGVQTSPQK